MGEERRDGCFLDPRGLRVAPSLGPIKQGVPCSARSTRPHTFDFDRYILPFPGRTTCCIRESSTIRNISEQFQSPLLLLFDKRLNKTCVQLSSIHSGDSLEPGGHTGACFLVLVPHLPSGGAWLTVVRIARSLSVVESVDNHNIYIYRFPLRVAGKETPRKNRTHNLLLVGVRGKPLGCLHAG